jgi:hypothetical protein
MTIQELIDLMNSRRGMRLTPLKEKILRSAWKGHTYADMADKFYYNEAYLKNLATEIWNDISIISGKVITKNNLRLKFDTEESEVLILNYNRLIDYKVVDENDIFEFPGSPISINCRFYVERPPLEDLAYYEIRKSGSVTCIHSPLKMGKSSLLIRILNQAQQVNYKTVTIDLKTIDNILFQDLDKFLRWFCVNVTRQLNLPNRIDEYWDDLLGSKVNCTQYFQDYILPSVHRPIVLAFNEFNKIFNQNLIVHEFSSLLRFWHEQSKEFRIWKKLRLVIVNSIKNFVPLDPNQSPFNVGLPLEILPFTVEQIQDLANRYQLDWIGDKGKNNAQILLELVNGHPYLVRLAFYYLVTDQLSLDELQKLSGSVIYVYQDYLKALLFILQRNPLLLAPLRELLLGRRPLDIDSAIAYQLESLGLIEFRENRATISCRLYKYYFGKKLTRDRLEVDKLN